MCCGEVILFLFHALLCPVALLVLLAAATGTWIVAPDLVCRHCAWRWRRNCCAAMSILAIARALPV